MCRIKPTPHIVRDVPKAVIGKMLLKQRQCTGSRHIRHQPHINLCDSAMWQNGLAPGTCVSTDQALDVDGGLGLEQHERVKPVCVMHPVLNSKLLLHCGFTAASGDILNHLHLCRSKR